MKLSWNPATTIITVEFNNGETVECSGSLWSRISSSLPVNIFNPINKYWNSRPPSEINEWEDIYRSIFHIFDQHLPSLETVEKVKQHIDRMFILMDWPKFKLWCILHGNISLNNGIKDTLDDKDKEGLTYYTSDYENLLVFSIMIKPIIPIWGLYHREYTEIVGKYFIHMSAMNMLKTQLIIELPPWLKICDYVEHFAINKIKTPGFSLVSGIGSDQIPDFLVSLALIKKIIVYDTEDHNGNIVKNVYHLLSERCTEISKTKPNPKNNVSPEGDDITISDKFKITQRIPPAISAMVEFYSKDVERLITDIDPSIPAEIRSRYITMNLDGLDLLEFHLPLLAVICKPITSGRTLQIVGYQTLLNYIRAASAAVDYWGYSEVAELLTTIPSKKDMFQITTSAMSNRSYHLLLPHLQNEVTLLYPYLSNDKVPGLILIDNVIREMVKFDWPINNPNFIDIRNSIAQVMLRQLGGKV